MGLLFVLLVRALAWLITEALLLVALHLRRCAHG
jgi:hypothetical protein